jgi:hypothetical protein
MCEALLLTARGCGCDGDANRDCPHVSKQVLDRTARLWRNIATINASDTRFVLQHSVLIPVYLIQRNATQHNTTQHNTTT